MLVPCSFFPTVETPRWSTNYSFTGQPRSNLSHKEQAKNKILFALSSLTLRGSFIYSWKQIETEGKTNRNYVVPFQRVMHLEFPFMEMEPQKYGIHTQKRLVSKLMLSSFLPNLVQEPKIILKARLFHFNSFMECVPISRCTHRNSKLTSYIDLSLLVLTGIEAFLGSVLGVLRR